MEVVRIEHKKETWWDGYRVSVDRFDMFFTARPYKWHSAISVVGGGMSFFAKKLVRSQMRVGKMLARFGHDDISVHAFGVI